MKKKVRKEKMNQIKKEKLGILNRNVIEININLEDLEDLKEENRKRLKLNARKFIAI